MKGHADVDANTEPGSSLPDGVLVIRALAQDSERHVFRINAEIDSGAGPGMLTVANADEVLNVVRDWLTLLVSRTG